MHKTYGHKIAHIVLNGFYAFFSEFQNITIAAQTRFEKAAWPEVHEKMRERLQVYKSSLSNIRIHLDPIANEAVHQLGNWEIAKSFYQSLIKGERNEDIMQTYFNSAFCLYFNHTHIKNRYMFTYPSQLSKKEVQCEIKACDFIINEEFSLALAKWLKLATFNDLLKSSKDEIETIASLILDQCAPFTSIITLRYLPQCFFRNKGAYLVGELIANQHTKPFVLAFNNVNSINIDALLFDTNEISKVFSFTRSYFMVDTRYPSSYVRFLQSILPDKALFELYNAIGFAKHGKTLFYRITSEETKLSKNLYEHAPGIKGMVMLVFNLPGVNYVYKVIKDRFTPPKQMTEATVKSKYRLVKSHDRAGRMADTYEFQNLIFDKNKFSVELLQDLISKAGSKVIIKGNALILKHVYVERKMTPLNIFLTTADDESIESAIFDYGNAIKELASANIFPGDMLLKNFGVTRHLRVVFYDYDEVTLLTECRFKKLPQAQNDDQAFAIEPWYSVDENDIFPEEFSLFFTGNPKAKYYFEKYHRDLYDPEYWQSLQQSINSGVVQSLFPYSNKYRF